MEYTSGKSLINNPIPKTLIYEYVKTRENEDDSILDFFKVERQINENKSMDNIKNNLYILLRAFLQLVSPYRASSHVTPYSPQPDSTCVPNNPNSIDYRKGFKAGIWHRLALSNKKLSPNNSPLSHCLHIIATELNGSFNYRQTIIDCIACFILYRADILSYYHTEKGISNIFIVQNMVCTMQRYLNANFVRLEKERKQYGNVQIPEDGYDILCESIESGFDLAIDMVTEAQSIAKSLLSTGVPKNHKGENTWKVEDAYRINLIPDSDIKIIYPSDEYARLAILMHLTLSGRRYIYWHNEVKKNGHDYSIIVL